MASLETLTDASTSYVSLRHPTETTFECPVCLDSPKIEDIHCLSKCGHTFCVQCLAAHMQARMDDGGVDIMCPYDACDALIEAGDAEMLLGPTKHQQLQDRRRDRKIDYDAHAYRCFTPDCTFVAWWAGPEDGPPCFQCDMCSASRCLQCDAAPYHAGQTCDEAGAGSVHDTLLSRLLTDGDIVACARCGQGIEKQHGCHKMKCRCGYRFCFACGSENAQCGCTPRHHGFIDNVTGRGDFSFLRQAKSPAVQRTTFVPAPGLRPYNPARHLSPAAAAGAPAPSPLSLSPATATTATAGHPVDTVAAARAAHAARRRRLVPACYALKHRRPLPPVEGYNPYASPTPTGTAPCVLSCISSGGSSPATTAAIPTTPRTTSRPPPPPRRERRRRGRATVNVDVHADVNASTRATHPAERRRCSGGVKLARRPVKVATPSSATATATPPAEHAAASFSASTCAVGLGAGSAPPAAPAPPPPEAAASVHSSSSAATPPRPTRHRHRHVPTTHDRRRLNERGRRRRRRRSALRGEADSITQIQGFGGHMHQQQQLASSSSGKTEQRMRGGAHSVGRCDSSRHRHKNSSRSLMVRHRRPPWRF